MQTHAAAETDISIAVLVFGSVAPKFFLASAGAIDGTLVEAVINFNGLAARPTLKRINRLFPRKRRASCSFFRVVVFALVGVQSRSLLSRLMSEPMHIPPDIPRLPRTRPVLCDASFFLIGGETFAGTICRSLVVPIVDKNGLATTFANEFVDRTRTFRNRRLVAFQITFAVSGVFALPRAIFLVDGARLEVFVALRTNHCVTSLMRRRMKSAQG